MALGRVLETLSHVVKTRARVELCSHSERLSAILPKAVHVMGYCPRPAYFKLRPRILIDVHLKHDC